MVILCFLRYPFLISFLCQKTSSICMSSPFLWRLFNTFTFVLVFPAPSSVCCPCSSFVMSTRIHKARKGDPKQPKSVQVTAMASQSDIPRFVYNGEVQPVDELQEMMAEIRRVQIESAEARVKHREGRFVVVFTQSMHFSWSCLSLFRYIFIPSFLSWVESMLPHSLSVALHALQAEFDEVNKKSVDLTNIQKRNLSTISRRFNSSGTS